MQGHFHSCLLLLVRTCSRFCCAARCRICELSLPQKSWRDRLLHAILPLIVFIWLGMNWEACPRGQRVHVNKEQNKNVWQQKMKKDLLWIIERSITAGALVDSWCCKSQYDTILIIKSLWCTFNLIHPRRLVEWPCTALGQLCTETDQSCLSY